MRDDSLRDELLNEARILLAVPPHPALPMVREDFFDGDGTSWRWTGWRAPTLRRLLGERGRPGLAPSSVLAYLAQAAEALTHLHSQYPPVIHGDVKPANLILTKGGRVKLVDFGLSSAPGAPRRRAGTPGFRAPELAAGGVPSRASDVYSLAATAFALLSGSAPAGVLPSWEGIDPAQAEQLEAAIRLGMATDPARRPATPGELVESLRAGWAAALPTGVMTFCFSDIEGSTALWETQPEAMAEALVRHDEMIADAVEARGGRLIKSMGEGDSTVSVFDSAPPARRGRALLPPTRWQAEPWPGGLRSRRPLRACTRARRRRRGRRLLRADASTWRRGCAGRRTAARSSSPRRRPRSWRDTCRAGCELVDLGPHRLRGLTRAGEDLARDRARRSTRRRPPSESARTAGCWRSSPTTGGSSSDVRLSSHEILARLAPRSAAGRRRRLGERQVVGAARRRGRRRAGGGSRGDRARPDLTPGAEPRLEVTGDPRELVVVDQFEELYTLCETRRAATPSSTPCSRCASPVVIGVRADLYGRSSAHAAPGAGGRQTIRSCSAR